MRRPNFPGCRERHVPNPHCTRRPTRPRAIRRGRGPSAAGHPTRPRAIRRGRGPPDAAAGHPTRPRAIRISDAAAGHKTRPRAIRRGRGPPDAAAGLQSIRRGNFVAVFLCCVYTHCIFVRVARNVAHSKLPYFCAYCLGRQYHSRSLCTFSHTGCRHFTIPDFSGRKSAFPHIGPRCAASPVAAYFASTNPGSLPLSSMA